MTRWSRNVWAMFGLAAWSWASGAAAANWPCWRGPERNGISRETGWTHAWGSAGPAVLWRASVGKGFSSFAAADGRVYTLGNADGADSVFCFESETGKLCWRHTYPCEPQPLSYEGGPSATPAVSGGRVYTFSKGGDLFCLDARDGRVIWSKKCAPWPWREGDWKNTWRYAGSPLVAADRLYMSLGESGAALDARDGKVLWESPAGHPGYSSPVPYRAGNEAALAFFSGRAAIGMVADSGKRLWRIPWQTAWDMNAADPIIHENRLFVSSGNGVGGALYDLSTEPPRELWRNKHLRLPMNSAVLWQGCLYGFNDESLVCVEWATGEKKWSESSVRRGSLTAADGRLVLLSENGKLVVAEAAPQAYRPLAQAQILEGRCWSVPVLSGGLLFARNAQGDVVCLSLRPGPK
ncbi:MAG TPA: PQQ-like beta-propeller repeat protein [Kiritimatiellia bacterium]|nr:PQQ-like beta-propeller repeat protein [Kiritimatiellia bacterium]HPS06501.1 PQQ-like beta-propeller repeat protein [Kiritimatiellia bacterium]